MRVQSVLFSLTITLCLALAASGLAFVAGRQAADPEGRYERGFAEGERIGRAAVQTEFAPGTDAYRAIYDRGRSEGFRDGRARGRRDGERVALTTGREDVFGGFKGGWSIGDWYLVNIRPGDDGAEYGIGARVEMRRDTRYWVCGGVHICRKAR
jgi:hypothetical protein